PRESVPRIELEDLAPPPAPSRHLVICMQIGSSGVVTLEGSYVRGHMKSIPGLRELLADLQPRDRVALVSFDSRFKLWQDFTTDHARVAEALFDAVGFGEPPPLEPPVAGEPSIARWLSEAQMREAASAARAAQLLAAAMDRVDGVKDVVWIGWGFGKRTSAAIASMQRSDTVVSVLDVTQADSHLLGASLETLAEATGGTYADLFRWPSRSLKRLRRQLTGYFILTLDLPAEPVRGRLRVEVEGREGRVLMKPYTW
ncbi:MAG: hypothetical protein AAF725_27880, partial [Acidobacteriota bacterium]